jgi:hypothetical protein
MTPTLEERARELAGKILMYAPSDTVHAEYVANIVTTLREVERAAYERAAKIAADKCDTYNGPTYDGGSGSFGYDKACDDIESAIRALAEDKR